jgi:type I restriction enzyme R subunit
MDISERDFEVTIEQLLLLGGPHAAPLAAPALRDAASAAEEYIPGGYHRRQSGDYDRDLCLIPQDTLDFLYATQPKEWDKLKRLHGHAGDAKEAKDHLLKRLASEVDQRGTLDVLRKGIKLDGCRFQLAYFHPASGLNEAMQKLYQGNLFAEVRQLAYGAFGAKDGKTLDLALFLNGLPIFTAELKNPLNRQNVQDAIWQYRNNRDPRERLFAFGRCLAHFAVDPDLVYVTTHLQGAKTRFLPFNQGRGGGAGNERAWRGFSTAYLWENIWARDSVLNLIQQFIHIVEEEDDRGRKTGARTLLFPRYHQLDAVRRLVRDAREKGAGQRYLIQHSAGSGKSNSIAWLAHQLSILHDAADRRVFDSIIVVTDRRVLDRQLQRTVLQFQQVDGVVENIDTTSRQLKHALEDGKTIIVSTVQKFPVIAGQMGDLPGHRFAVIVDEAHSSQGGESTKGLRSVLATESLEQAERADKQDQEAADSLEDRIIAEVKRRGRAPNVSYFAFTATPKAETMELFGTRRQDGAYQPFSLYSMRQAIEEGFILDVLANYATYKTYWNLLKKVAEDPRYDREKATALLCSFVDLHEQTMARRVQIMVDHFAGQIMPRINGKAKAMIVTRSRLHAVRFKLAVDAHIVDRHYPFKALVAFSGVVKDGGIDYTEANMNGFPETRTAEEFKHEDNRLLVVANKFQTGFDQPLLHTMYVDKPLMGLNAVQTLSRLNRVALHKEDTMVLDFANEAESIQSSFQPYYDRLILPQGTDPNVLYDLETRLEDAHIFTQTEVERFAQSYFSAKGTQAQLYAALRPAEDRYKASDEQQRAAFRGALADYVRLYAFLSQILPFADAGLEKMYQFARLLLRRLPVSRERLPVEIQQQIDIDSYRVHRKGVGRLVLQPGVGELAPIEAKSQKSPGSEDQQPLSIIIGELNTRFGTDFSPEDRVFIEQLETRLNVNNALRASVKINPPDNSRLTFDHVVNDVLQDMIDTNFKFYKQVNDNADFAKTFTDWLFERYLKRSKANGKPVAPPPVEAT